MRTVMAKYEERFTNKAEIYKKYRPSYPKELIDYLYTKVGFCRGSVIADIGAGTGIFGRLLLEKGSRVYSVEPNADMRRIAEADLSGFANFVSVDAPAEHTRINDHSIDFVTAAQAFHWFDELVFRAECKRILRPGGKVVLVWNVRDYSNEIVQKDYAIRERYCIDRGGLGENGGPPKDTRFFAYGICETMVFQNDLILDRNAYIGMNLTRSYAPTKESHPDKFHGFVSELGMLFDECSVNGILAFPHTTRSFVGDV